MHAERVIIVRRLRAGSLYKLLLYGLGISFVLVGILFGVGAFLGVATVSWNLQALHGIRALLISPLMFALLAIAFTASIGSMAAIGLWILSLWHPLALRVVVADKDRSQSN